MGSSQKYIYFAGDNLLGTKYYRKAIIIGETADLIHRQHMYSPGKGMAVPPCGDLVSHTGMRGLLWPFIDFFPAPNGWSDRRIHELLIFMRPFKDMVYPIRDPMVLHTKEAFGFYGDLPIEDTVYRLKRLLLEYLDGA